MLRFGNATDYVSRSKSASLQSFFECHVTPCHCLHLPHGLCSSRLPTLRRRLFTAELSDRTTTALALRFAS